MIHRAALLLISLLLASHPLRAEERGGAAIHLGSGAKAGEMTDRSAIVLVRLTATTGQDDRGLIPGREGLARLRFGLDEGLEDASITPWEAAKSDDDYSIQFALRDLRPASRYHYRVESKADADGEPKLSEMFSFVTAPAPDDRRRSSST